MSLSHTLFITLLLVAASAAFAAKVVDVRTVDQNTVMVVVHDSEVRYTDDGKGPTAFQGHESSGPDELILHNPPLKVDLVPLVTNFSLTSPMDRAYRMAVSPIAVYRKTKVSGTAWGWPEPRVSFEHTLYLKFDTQLQSGVRYRLSLNPALGVDKTQADFLFDQFSSISEAVKVNLIAYHPDQAMKSADLYMWLGDGGPRDYTAFVGRKVWVVDAKTNARTEVGKVQFWKLGGKDLGDWNTTKSAVWNVDFSTFRRTGTYRLVVEGVGCSQPFVIRRDAYRLPFQTSLRGFYYMRIGEPKTLTPAPRQPRFIPDVDPPGFKVYLTTLTPWHPDWAGLPGDPWDVKDWSKWNEPGNPTNPNAYGGHSDALDWDRHAGHISIIWDLLMPYILTNGKGGEDNLGIIESGNGIPDAIDEARNEVDFWLRLRDRKGGYSAGLNNPTPDHKMMFQAGTRPYMAWASAANAAMLADAFAIARRPKERDYYLKAALEAWGIANEQDLDLVHTIGNGKIRGKDLKQMAAASLYNVTGEKKYEDLVISLSDVPTPTSPTEVVDKQNQMWGVASYLSAGLHKRRPIHYQAQYETMRQAVIHEAKVKNVANNEKWPSRRCADPAYGWFQTVTEVQRVCIAHAVANNDADRALFHRALILEADYSLGRNPLNLALMTGIGKRHVEDIYTSGRNDGVPGVHPGHTPYMNAEAWGEGFMADPKWMANQGYPAWNQWPHGEAYWPARYVYANNEFTPQQSMRGKHFLYATLHALEAPNRR